jgi:hypothetical protein
MRSKLRYELLRNEWLRVLTVAVKYDPTAE